MKIKVVVRRAAKVTLVALGLAWAAVITRYVVRLDMRDGLRPGGA